ncbi:MAG: signal peptidase I [Sulfuritalea sp.]|nr:signal peptidase I [Sulfuritalea sp.]
MLLAARVSRIFSRKAPRPSNGGRWWWQFAALLLALIGTGESLRLLGQHYRIGVDLQLEQNCLPARLVVVKIGHPESFVRGDVLAYRTDRARPYITEERLMGKRVAGLPGDRYRVERLAFYVNGTPAGKLNLCQTKYLPRYCDDREGVVPPDSLLMMADHPNSFDSRYWGPIPQRQVVGTIIWPELRMGAA